jgi:hypothetical protein
LVKRTLASASTAPVGSATRPRTRPPVLCPKADAKSNANSPNDASQKAGARRAVEGIMEETSGSQVRFFYETRVLRPKQTLL